MASKQPVAFGVLGFVDSGNRLLPSWRPEVAAVSLASVITDARGQARIMVTFHEAGRIGIEVDATALDALYVHAFAVGEDTEITHIVATPQVDMASTRWEACE